MIVDDDPSIRKLLEKVMKSNDLESASVGSGREALELLKGGCPYDAILMDVMLGDMEGFDVIKSLRNQGIQTPVIIISGRDEDYDALYGLSLGADDYITKPFRPLIVGAKVKALIRREKGRLPESGGLVKCGPFTYDAATMRFYKDDEELLLSAREGSLFLLFLQNPDHVFTRDALYQHVWDNAAAVDDNTIMVYINHLRSKIEADPARPAYIQTVRGIGYRFRVS